jgi:tetratricopeptide (TPR) repeat protein
MMIRRVFISIAVGMMLGAFLDLPAQSRADDAAPSWVSRVVSIQGDVVIKRRDGNDWQPAGLDDTLFAGDRIRVKANSRAGIVLSNDAVLRLDQETTLVFTEVERRGTFIFNLLKGAANFFSHRPRSLKIVTPFVNGVVEGTEFFVQVDDETTRIDLFEGRILAQNAYGELQLSKGRGAVARTGQAPQSRIAAQPRESVQWALYYPPVLTVGPDRGPESLGEALAFYNQGRPVEALERLDAVAQPDRNAQFHTLRAGLLLNVGRVDRAKKDLRRALALDGANSEALALQAVVAVVQNRQEESLATAQTAVQDNPRSAAAHIALSYAHQAGFNLPKAMQSARSAVSHAPDNGTAWARLAELQLSTGQLGQGIASAKKAAALNPRVAHAQTMLGFAWLTRIKTRNAREAFRNAIALDSTAPLPRLGLGLAIIRDGDLEKGRSQIEIAAGLDPGNALIRSYLGKAYFDEKRGPRDQRQFEIAKSLDPNAPTPWFYDAIRKQTLNRPVEALHDLQTAIALNDNRAVFRSRMMLDEDLAARSAGVGRIFSDLGVEEMALRSGWNALNIDPANYSAHRLLSDTYAARPRHKIARVSELLQSQLYQPLNLTPIQPQLSQSTLIASQGMGIYDTAFAEFNPLFNRDRLTFQANGVAGEQRTRGEDLTLAGLQQWFSYSLGQYHFETDGFRQNNDLERDILDIFTQARIADNASVQLEYRSIETDNGGLTQGFDPDDFSENLREHREEKIPRFGLHYMPTANQHAIVSLIYNSTDYTYRDTALEETSFGPLQIIDDRSEDNQTYNAEGQYLFQTSKVNMVVGAGHYVKDAKIDTSSTTKYLDYPDFDIDPFTDPYDEKERHSNAYLYSTISATSNLQATFGLSADSYKVREHKIDQWNPKAGVSLLVSPRFTLRASAFRTLKRSLVTNQTIEPTQISGFNQLYDDPTATDAKRYGTGFDYSPRPTLFLGAEMTFGDLSVPIITRGTGNLIEEEWEEKLHRFYVCWLPVNQLVVSIDYRYEYTSRKPPNPDNIPIELDTHYLPVSAGFFHRSGLHMKLQGQYIRQKVKQFIAYSPQTDTMSDDFFIVDASVGYRFPGRFGSISISATNLFDTDFNFSDGNLAYGTAEYPSVRPERQLLGRITLSF